MSSKSAVQNVLIVGATGGLGQFVVDGFLAPRWRGVFVPHVLIRAETLKKNSEKKNQVDRWAEAGAVIRVGGLESAKSAADATKGIDVVVSVLGGLDWAPAHAKLVEGAKASGVRRFVVNDYSLDSTYWEENKSAVEPTPLFAWRRAALQAVIDAGMEWTRITTGIFSNYLFSPVFGLDVKTGTARLVGSPDLRVNGTSRVDIGGLLPYVLHHSSSRNAHVRLVGDVQTCRTIVQGVNQHVLPAYHGGSKKQLDVTYVSAEQLQAQQTGKAPTDFMHIVAGLQLAVLSQHGVVEKAASWNAQHVPEYVTQTFDQYFRATGSVPV